MRIKEVASEQRFDCRDCFIRGQVLRDVTGGMTPQKGEARPGIQRHRPDENILQARVLAPVLAKRELVQSAFANRVADKLEEALGGSRLRHAGSVWLRMETVELK